MALWKDPTSSGSGFAGTASPISSTSRDGGSGVAPLADAQRRSGKDRAELKESVLSAGLTLEGKINGTGHVRIAGRFKGDVHIDGTLTLDEGARIEGHVKAAAVVVGGELMGNIVEAQQVDLREGGRIEGDIKAGSFTVASGARMRGKVEFGWNGAAAADTDSLTESVITGTV
jgi:cytoskeletal protein CcmA (bactofilin family)